MSTLAIGPDMVKLLAVLITLVVSGLGLLALLTGHAAERWTRFGYAGPLEGSAAQAFGLAVFFLGLLPLMLLMRRPTSAAWFGAVVAVLGLLSMCAGLWAQA